jgi:hypothetical protein
MERAQIAMSTAAVGSVVLAGRAAANATVNIRRQKSVGRRVPNAS